MTSNEAIEQIMLRLNLPSGADIAIESRIKEACRLAVREYQLGAFRPDEMPGWPGQPLNLAVGMHVLTVCSYVPVTVVIEEIDNFHTGTRLWVRRPGVNKAGRRYSGFYRESNEIHAIVADPLTASVYSDYLEESGEPTAAAKLRAKFPLPVPSSPDEK